MAESSNPMDQLTKNMETMEKLVQKQIEQTEKLISGTQKDLETFKPLESNDYKLDDHMKTIQEQVEKTLANAIKACDDGLRTLIENQLSQVS
jgi:biopolymer transport protein ExbB/TolQ